MKRLELFKALCETTDALEKVTCVLLPGPTRTALEALCDRMDGLIDRCVREGVQPLHAADRSPCPACGQACCTHWRVLQGARPVAEEAP
jgi:hypothetical protein